MVNYESVITHALNAGDTRYANLHFTVIRGYVGNVRNMDVLHVVWKKRTKT